MNWTHAHLLLNHFPTIGMIIGLGLFLVALALKSDHLKSASLVIFFMIALLSIFAFITGTSAKLSLDQNPQISKALIDKHETAAFEALWLMELTGALGWLGLWQYRRLSRWPQGTMAAVGVAGLLTLALMTRAANFGGEIHHEEIRSTEAAVETPPAKDAAKDVTTDPAKDPAKESDPADPQLARIIGDAMVNWTWTWAASETVHFVGLSLLFGVVLLIDLRMLGFLKSIPYTTLHRLLPWGIMGFGLNVVTGILFFIGGPPTFYVTNPTFYWKMVLIVIGGVNALYFTMFDQPWSLGAGDTPPLTAKVAAASGIVLWTAVIFCGQMLPFLGHSF